MANQNSVQSVEVDSPAWIAYLQSHPKADIFHTPAWSRLMADTYHYKPKVITVEDREGNIKAALPYLEKRSMFGGTEWLSLPFTDHCEILADGEQYKNELIKVLGDQLERSGLKEIEVRNDLSIEGWHRDFEKFVIHKLELGNESESVWQGMHSMHRRNIRQAKKNGLRTELGYSIEMVENFYQLHLDTRQRKGVPIQPRSFFKNLHSLIIDKKQGFVVQVIDGDEVVASAIFLNWGETLTYKYGASLLKAQASRANNLLMWAAIEWGCLNGFRILDLGRTDTGNQGLRDYKSRWGADERPLTYSYSSPRSSGSLTGKLMELASPVIQRMPKWFTQVAGEIVYRLMA